MNLLTVLIGLLGARGPNAKAWASTAIPAILGIILGPQVIEQFQLGVGTALEPAAYALGMAVGGLIASGIQYAITWWSPANTPKDKDA